MKVHSFTVNTVPKAQMRARSAYNKPDGKPGFISHHKHKKQERREDVFIALLYDHLPSSPLSGPLFLHFTAFLPRPKNDYGTGRNVGNLKASAPHYHTKKPDLDNLAKFLKDCLNKMFYKDDKQIVSMKCRKEYSENPRWEIKIFELEE